MKTFVPIFFLLGLVTSMAAQAEEPTVFLGIAVGYDFTLNECPAETLYGGTKIYEYKETNYPCWIGYAPGKHGPVKDGDFLQFLPKGQAPKGVKTVYVTVQDGKAAEVTAYTDGFTHQDTVHQALIDKFGKPTSDKIEKVKAGSGAEFDRIVTQWDRPKIRFYGLSGSIDQGYVTVYSEAGYKREMDDAAKKQGSF